MAKKEKKFADLDLKNAVTKRKELVKDIVNASVTMDVEAYRERGGLAGLNRDLRNLNKKIAQLSVAKA